MPFIKAALITQIVVLIGFVCLTASLHRKCKKHGPFPKNMKNILITLYCSAALIGIRAIYRTVEYYSIPSLRITAEINTSSVSPIIRNEAFFWVFEALLRLANSFLMNFRNPMSVLPRDSRVYLTEDGTRELVGPGYEDVRFFLIAMVDPFDLIGLITGRNRTNEFWKVDAGLEEDSESKVMNRAVHGQEADIEKAAGVDTNVTNVNGSGAGPGNEIASA
jgi:hypothetical protein